ncbi:helix-turn-helix domain-containing protein [Kitasatospora sp. NPDC001574]
MSAEHMGMVFRAAGLKGPEKCLLLTYTNLTDSYGYCWPGEERLSDDSGMPVRSVQRAKAALVAKNLIKSVRRTDRQTGDPISNLTRVNLPLLASMARKRTRYDDDLMAGLITFEDDNQGDPETTLPAIDAAQDGPQKALEAPATPEKTASDLLSRHIGGTDDALRTLADLLFRQYGGSVPPMWREGTANMADNLSEIPKGSLSPLPLTGTTPPSGAAPQEREIQASPPKGKAPKATKAGRKQAGSRAAASAPAPVEAEPVDAAVLAEAEKVVAAYVAASGRPMVTGTRKTLTGQAAEHLVAGYPAAWLVDRVREMAAQGWTDLELHCSRSKKPLPGQREQQPAPATSQQALCEVCRDDDGLVYTRDPLTGSERAAWCSHGQETAQAGMEMSA